MRKPLVIDLWKRARALAPDEVGVDAPAWWELPLYVPIHKRKSDARPCMTLQDMAEWAIWQTKYPKPPPLKSDTILPKEA